MGGGNFSLNVVSLVYFEVKSSAYKKHKTVHYNNTHVKLL